MQTQLDRMEEMLTSLISILGDINSDQKLMKAEPMEMKKDISEMKAEQVGMKTGVFIMKEEMKLMRVDNEKRHSEVMNRFHTLEADHEHTWEKTVKNEREFAVFKKQFELQNTDV